MEQPSGGAQKGGGWGGNDPPDQKEDRGGWRAEEKGGEAAPHRPWAAGGDQQQGHLPGIQDRFALNATLPGQQDRSVACRSLVPAAPWYGTCFLDASYWHPQNTCTKERCVSQTTTDSPYSSEVLNIRLDSERFRGGGVPYKSKA